MTRLIWSRLSRRNLREIQSYIARDSQKAARRFIDRIKRVAESLTTFPAAGAIVPEWQQSNIREVFVGDYRLIYRMTSGEVEVVTIIHGAKQLPDFLA